MAVGNVNIRASSDDTVCLCVSLAGLFQVYKLLTCCKVKMSLDSILKVGNMFNTLKPNSYKIAFNNLLYSYPHPDLKRSLLLFLKQNSVDISIFPHVCYMFYPSPSLLNEPKHSR